MVRPSCRCVQGQSLRSDRPQDAAQQEPTAGELQRLLGEGALGQLVQPWEPWWKLPEASTMQLSRTGERLVQPQAGPAGVPPLLCCGRVISDGGCGETPWMFWSFMENAMF